MERKLSDRGYDAASINGALDDLAGSGLVDDARVAAAHVRTAAAIKGRGRVRIARELMARGIDRTTIDGALGPLKAQDELAAIRQVLQRKRWTVPATPSERQRMFRHLLGRGFTADAIGRALGRSDSDD